MVQIWLNFMGEDEGSEILGGVEEDEGTGGQKRLL